MEGHKHLQRKTVTRAGILRDLQDIGTGISISTTQSYVLGASRRDCGVTLSTSGNKL